MLQQLYLSQCTLCQNLLAEDIGDLLDRNSLLGLGVRSRAGKARVSGCLAKQYREAAYQTMP